MLTNIVMSTIIGCETLGPTTFSHLVKALCK